MKNQIAQKKINEHLTNLFELASPFSFIDTITESLHAKTEEMIEAVKDSKDEKEIVKTMLEIEAITYQINMLNLTLVGLHEEWKVLDKTA